MVVSRADRRRLCLYLIAPALCDAILPSILEAALDRDETASALCVGDRHAAVRDKLAHVLGTLRVLRSVGSLAAEVALASILMLDEWTDESLDAMVDRLGAAGEAAASGHAVRTLVIGRYAGSAGTLEAAKGRLARVVAACVHVEAVMVLGKLEHLAFDRSLARCDTLTVVTATWHELDATLRPFTALRTLHIDGLSRGPQRTYMLFPGARAVFANLRELSLGVGSLDSAEEIIWRCSTLEVRTMQSEDADLGSTCVSTAAILSGSPTNS